MSQGQLVLCTLLGIFIGIWPLAYGTLKGDIKYAIIGFAATIILSIAGGLLMGLPTAAFAVYYTRKKSIETLAKDDIAATKTS